MRRHALGVVFGFGLGLLCLASTVWAGVLDRQTYMTSNTFTPTATPTDLITIAGSATKVVTVRMINVSTTNTAAGSQQFSIVKRSTLDTAGTFVASPAVPLDSIGPGGQPTTSTATVGHYTANPGGLGTAVGTVHTPRVASPAVVPGAFVGLAGDSGIDLLKMPMVLRGAAENVAVNFGGAALVLGQIHAYTIIWTEE